MIHFVSRQQIDAIIKECQKLDELMVLVVMQEDGSGFTAVCDHIVSHCDDLIYTHITKGYASFVFSNNSKIEVVTDKYKGKGKKYNSMIIDKNIDSELIKTICAPFNNLAQTPQRTATDKAVYIWCSSTEPTMEEINKKFNCSYEEKNGVKKEKNK